MSLADELLADLEDNEDGEEAIAEENVEELEENEEEMPYVDHRASLMEIDVHVNSIRQLCKLRDSERLKNILAKIDHYISHPRKSIEMIGNVESDPEYQLIVEANSTAAEVDNEICEFTKHITLLHNISFLI